MTRRWHKGASLYQIYPRSFMDASHDGTGDLRGIISRLDHFRGSDSSLGVDAIWLSPVNTSPMADFGYDISDYCDIDPIFGTLEDFDELVKACHQRGLKLVMDFVPNHSSDQHPWFQESRSSTANPYRDWYVWKDPKADGSPPTNWESIFGGPAWTLDETTGQYYHHSFLSSQPDLNWDNPEVQHAMKNVMRFWLDRGVDGLRIDAVKMLPVDPDFRDHRKGDGPDNPGGVFGGTVGDFDADKKLAEYFESMVSVLHEYDDRCMLLEHYPDGIDKPEATYNVHILSDPAVSAPFNFSLMFKDWKAKDFKSYIDEYQRLLGEEHSPVYVMGNHDQSRLASRFGERRTRAAATLLLTLPGTIVTYYGEEIGMIDGKIAPNQVRDPWEINVPGKGLGRDPERTPMQWNDERSAGFSSVEPWLPVNPDFKTRNVEALLKDDKSILNLYRELTKRRQQSDVLRYGTYEPVKTVHSDVFAYRRLGGGGDILVMINFSDKAVVFDTHFKKGSVMLSSYMDLTDDIDLARVKLRPDEGIVVDLIV